MIKFIKPVGQYLDQPLLVAKFKQAVPKIFVGGATIYGMNEIRKAPEDARVNKTINTTAIMAATVGSALAAPKIASKIIGKPYEKYCVKNIINKNTNLVNDFIETPVGKNVSKGVKNILNKAKDNVLGFKDIKILDTELSKTKEGTKFMKTLIPEPENITSKDIKNEIGRLSILGFIPVAGGVAGGLAGEKITNGELEKNHTANRVKEGAYQYLANIFLCNVGAGIALAGLEAAKVKSKAARAVGMVAGIITTGIIGGSTIANYIGKKVINPIFDKNIDKKEKLNSERTPEVLDICLHSDDIATIAVMSGLRWIEPTLPILYGISGYRAGIGYRNGHKHKNKKQLDHNG